MNITRFFHSKRAGNLLIKSLVLASVIDIAISLYCETCVLFGHMNKVNFNFYEYRSITRKSVINGE